MRNPATCSHSKDTSHYVTRETWDDEVTEWVEETTSTMEDIDLHRMKCSQCGAIGYYSGAARAFHEQGITSPINGLDGKPEKKY